MPLPFSLSVATLRMAAMPIAGMAGMKNVTVTCAPVIGAPSAPVSLTRKLLLPMRGVDGSEEYSIVAPCGALIAAAAPTPGGGGANDPNDAASWLSESIRKLAEVAMRSPALRPF